MSDKTVRIDITCLRPSFSYCNDMKMDKLLRLSSILIIVEPKFRALEITKDIPLNESNVF